MSVRRPLFVFCLMFSCLSFTELRAGWRDAPSSWLSECKLAYFWLGQLGAPIDDWRVNRLIGQKKFDRAIEILRAYGHHDEAAILHLRQGNVSEAIRDLLDQFYEDVPDDEPFLSSGNGPIYSKWAKLRPRSTGVFEVSAQAVSPAPRDPQQFFALGRTAAQNQADNYLNLPDGITNRNEWVLSQIDRVLDSSSNSMEILQELLLINRHFPFASTLPEDTLRNILYLGALRDRDQGPSNIFHFIEPWQVAEDYAEGYETYLRIQNLQIMQALGLRPVFREDPLKELANQIEFENTFPMGPDRSATIVMERERSRDLFYINFEGANDGYYSKAYVLIRPEDLYGMMPFFIYSARVSGAKQLKFSATPYDMQKHDYFTVYFMTENQRQEFSDILTKVFSGTTRPTSPPPLSYAVGTFVSGGTDLPGENHRARVATALVEALLHSVSKNEIVENDVDEIFRRHALDYRTYRTISRHQP